MHIIPAGFVPFIVISGLDPGTTVAVIWGMLR